MISAENLIKQGVTYTDGDVFFRDQGGAVHFADIAAFFVRSVDHMTNLVYQGHEYHLVLWLKGQRENYRLKATSDRSETYRTLSRIHDAIFFHMVTRLERMLKRGPR